MEGLIFKHMLQLSNANVCIKWKIVANDASHIKIQNVNLSYVVAMDKMNVNWIKTVNFFMDISNVFYFYKTKSPADRNGVAEFRFKYPEARTLTFGFQANF